MMDADQMLIVAYKVIDLYVFVAMDLRVVVDLVAMKLVVVQTLNVLLQRHASIVNAWTYVKTHNVAIMRFAVQIITIEHVVSAYREHLVIL